MDPVLKPKSRQECAQYIEIYQTQRDYYKQEMNKLYDEKIKLLEAIDELERNIRWNLGIIVFNVIIIVCCFLIMIN
jgi:hypothetical protein